MGDGTHRAGGEQSVAGRTKRARWAESKGKEKSRARARARGGKHKHSNYTASYIFRQCNELYSSE